MKLLLATTSRGKIREQRVALEGLDLEVMTLEAFVDLDPPVEPGPAFADNAVVKALYYHRVTGLSSIGEDSGLVVDFLGGEPGVESARWLGKDTSYDVKNGRLLELLAEAPEPERAARYVSAVALAEGGGIVFTAEGVCEGRIAREPRGEGGFGYDPIFYYPPFEKTMAELEKSEKNAISHRGKAMAALREYLLSRYPSAR